MRVVIQRVSEAAVRVGGTEVGAIGTGMMVLVGVECGDTDADVEWLVGKVAGLRIFPKSADDDVMDRSITDIGGDVLAISQFTLTAGTRKGNRPSYIRAARGPEAQPLYDRFCARLGATIGREVRKGVFGADMKVSLVNDGPVTIIIDSRIRE